MGNKRVESVWDLIRWSMDLTAECTRCGRFAVFDAREVSDFLVARSLPPAFPPPLKLRCRCGGRDMRFAGAPTIARPQPLPPRKVGLVPIYVRDR